MKDIRTETDLDTEIGIGGGRFVVFYSSWCPFCTIFIPAFDKASEKRPSIFVKVRTDELPELEERFSVEVVPTVLFFKGGELAGRLDGAPGRGLTEGQLTDFINSCGA